MIVQFRHEFKAEVLILLNYRQCDKVLEQQSYFIVIYGLTVLCFTLAPVINSKSLCLQFDVHYWV
jgi:hypothetical protein